MNSPTRRPSCHCHGGGGGEAFIEIVEAAILFGGILLLFVVPITICSFVATLRPWRRWYTAMGAGFGGVAAGAVCGVATAWILKMLTE